MQASTHSHGDLISLLGSHNAYMDSMDERRSALGKRVAGLRQAKLLTQPALAADAGLSQPTLWAIEKGETKEVTARSLFALAGALGTTVEYLWDGRSGEEEESELVAIFRRLAPNGRMAVLQAARAVLAANPPPPPRLTAIQSSIEHPPEAVPKKFPQKHLRKHKR